MSLFKIQINAGKPAVFSPKVLTVSVNDSVFWGNGDKEAHWPTPNAATPKAWLDFQIAPNGVSSQISFGPANPPANYTVNYVCSLHPGETGQIKVIGKTKKGPFGKNTKTGAFGGKSKKSPYGQTTKKGAFGKTTK
jgi:plastocyanin